MHTSEQSEASRTERAVGNVEQRQNRAGRLEQSVTERGVTDVCDTV